MNSLDDVSAMQKLDSQNLLASIAEYVAECEEAWGIASKLEFPSEYKQAKNMVASGMGGSRFPITTIKYLFSDRITVPFEVTNAYSLPSYVGPDSVVLLSSYSGTTEETISSGEDALKKGAKTAVITKGGKLAEMMSEHKLPGYLFSGTHNSSGQPRMGGGYTMLGTMGILKSLGFLNVTDEEVAEACTHANKVASMLAPEVPEVDNEAKKLARTLKDTIPFLVGAEFLQGYLNGFANQINECAKMVSDFRVISELNHHLMEGLTHPEALHESGLFVFIDSDLYTERVKQRFTITKDVVLKQKVKIHTLKLSGSTKLAQVLEAYVRSSYTTFYLAMLYDIDPAPIPWVDYFKDQLGQPK